jgi:hypothetical protein
MNQEHFKNLHHAYLIEGEREISISTLIDILKSKGIETTGGSDFYQIALDTLKIEDARNLKETSQEKAFSNSKNAKKIFIISTNNILHEAQNTLLKLFEEPIEDTHYFVIMPDTGMLLKTFISRFYLIKKVGSDLDEKEAERFMKMSYLGRLDFIKKILDEEEGTRSSAVSFLNSLEKSLAKEPFDVTLLHHIFKVREFLRMPGSSAKMLLESVALRTPVLK